MQPWAQWTMTQASSSRRVTWCASRWRTQRCAGAGRTCAPPATSSAWWAPLSASARACLASRRPSPFGRSPPSSRCTGCGSPSLTCGRGTSAPNQTPSTLRSTSPGWSPPRSRTWRLSAQRAVRGWRRCARRAGWCTRRRPARTATTATTTTIMTTMTTMSMSMSMGTRTTTVTAARRTYTRRGAWWSRTRWTRRGKTARGGGWPRRLCARWWTRAWSTCRS
mmetsp:Transcript_3622/g.9045  ORF Transcript_3622/g.9045 Transcript_3622/m.9045 type:complete len:222 (+) Transcript_3622:333-998(+)